ncbi:MAG: xanthine dehydrogenase family protein molybdopterin-binding subunit [Thermaerobacter sp.]|nr:xanthine dehydrogenase family protein molybdopterin-binding subunit [Thermaerobacter sp.]
MRRQEDPPLLRGTARFVADLQAPGMLEAVIVRSIHGHARIDAIDCAAARAMPGVRAVIVARDLPADLDPIAMRLSPAPELAEALQYPLAQERVRYVGEPLAVVVASSRYLAEDAAWAVRVRYTPLETMASLSTALAGAPLFDGLDSNQVYLRTHQKGGGNAAVAASPRRLKMTFSIQRHTGMPLETRGLLVVPDGDRLTVYGSTKVVFFNRRILSHLLKVPVASLRFVETAVGGGFGIRGEFYPEDFLIPYLARLLQAPVRWIEDRVEHLQAANHSREQWHEVEVGFDETGQVMALADDIWVDNGAYIRTHGVTVPELTQAMLPGPYVWPALDSRLHVVLTNKTPIGTYRAPGRFEGTFVRERLLDAIAASLHLDPLTVRRRNLLQPEQLPYSNGLLALGQEVKLDSGDYPAALNRAAELMQAAEIGERKRLARRSGRLRGLGFAFVVEKSGLGPWEDSRLVLHADGTVTGFTGLADLGQGTKTLLARVVADCLGMAMERVRVVYGDTDQVAEGFGTFASRGTVMGGSAAYLAAVELRRRVSAVLRSDGIGCPDRDDITMTPSGIVASGVARPVPYGEVLRRAELQGVALDVTERFQATAMTYPYGAHGCEVDIDPGTGGVSIVRYGVVYDVGRAINRELVVDQIVGGVAQGLGGAMLEELAYDSHGQLQTGTLLDYLLPGACEVPEIEVVVTENAPAPSNPLGVKGAGEGGAAGVAPALANAVADAVGAPPEAFAALPIRPQEILRWIR